MIREVYSYFVLYASGSLLKFNMNGVMIFGFCCHYLMHKHVIVIWLWLGFSYFLDLLQYVYIIAGDDVIAFFKDILKFLTRQRNNRLSNMFYQFGRQYQNQYQEDPFALEKAILNTPTWWDSPTKYRRMVKVYLASLSSENEEYDSSWILFYEFWNSQMRSPFHVGHGSTMYQAVSRTVEMWQLKFDLCDGINWLSC